jgi:DNA-binding XRE family transcriptional regulator
MEIREEMETQETMATKAGITTTLEVAMVIQVTKAAMITRETDNQNQMEVAYLQWALSLHQIQSQQW